MANALTKAAEFDPVLVEKGVEVTYYMDEKPYRATITMGGEFNEALQRHSEKLMKPYRHSNMAFENLPLRKQKEFLAELYSVNVVLGWNEEDFQQKFSQEACKQTMLDVPEWRVFITNRSLQLDQFRRKAIEEVSGN